MSFFIECLLNSFICLGILCIFYVYMVVILDLLSESKTNLLIATILILLSVVVVGLAILKVITA